MPHVQIVYKQIGEIAPYQNNPRRNKRAVAAVAESIRRYGFLDPIVLDKNNVIICGHTRLLAAQKLVMSEVPCVYADDLSEEDVRAYRLADNKVSELAEWDDEKLETELLSVPEDMIAFGFARPMRDEAEQDNFHDVRPAWLHVENGDIWALGRHRLVVGDCLDAVLNGQRADMLFSAVSSAFAGAQMVTDLHDAATFFVKPGASFYLWHEDRDSGAIRGFCRDAGMKVRQCLIWSRQGMAFLPKDGYVLEHMPCLYGWFDGGTHLWASNRKQTTVLKYEMPPDGGMSVPLAAYCMLNNTRGMDVVLDPWCVNGEVFMAAEQIGRIAYAKTNKTDAGRIVARYINFFGQGDVRCLSHETA